MGPAGGNTRSTEQLSSKNKSLKTTCISQSLLLLLSRFSRVRLLAAPWTAAHQAPPSMGFSRQECWSGVPLQSLLMRKFYIITGAKALRFHIKTNLTLQRLLLNWGNLREGRRTTAKRPAGLRPLWQSTVITDLLGSWTRRAVVESWLQKVPDDITRLFHHIYGKDEVSFTYHE